MSMTVRAFEVVKFDAGLRCDLDAVQQSGIVDEGRSVACAGCKDARGTERWALMADDGDVKISCSACLCETLEAMGV
jgi:hypothetical protein